MFWRLNYIKALKLIARGKTAKSYWQYEKMLKKKCDISAIATYGYQLLKIGAVVDAEVVFASIDLSRINDKNELAVNMNLGLFYWITEEKEKAIDLTLKTLEKYKTTNLYINAGYFLALEGRYDETLKISLEGQEFSPENKAILDNLGYIYIKLNELEKAEKIYNKLFENSTPSFPECYYNFGILKKIQGKTEDAIKLFEEALKQPFSPLISLKETDVLKELNECRK